MHFARTLRAAGLPVGPGKVSTRCTRSRRSASPTARDFYWTLHAVFVNRPDQRQLFDQAFHVFWRNPELLKRCCAGPAADECRDAARRGRRDDPASRRGAAPAPADAREPEEQIEIDAAMTFSDREQLRGMDFEKMSLEELARAKAAIARLQTADPRHPDPPLRARPARRPRRHARDVAGGVALGRAHRTEAKSPRRRPPPLVVLCDISGSMSRYSRVFLHFMHSVTNDRDRVYTFVFGTRLTNITRYLRYRDVDVALDKVAETVADWSGGTASAMRRASSTAMVAPRARPGRGRADDHRRARPRRRHRPRARDGPAAPLVPPADLAQPAVALRGVRAKIIGDEGDAAAMSTSSVRCTISKAWRR